MSELKIGDKLIDPVEGFVILEDVTAGGTAFVRVVVSGKVLVRSIHYVRSFERVPSRRPAIALAFGGILFAALCAAGAYYG